MSKKIAPTDPEREKELGRVALWLDVITDLQWLSRHCDCSPDTPEEQKERRARIRFRANAALHKAGLKSDPPDDEHPLAWLSSSSTETGAHDE